MMKKIIMAVCMFGLSINAHALETHLMSRLSHSHGNVGHKFDSESFHAFHVHNEENKYHKYRWLIKQCVKYDNQLVCPENDGGELHLEAGQEFEFTRKLTMKLNCGRRISVAVTYAKSYLERDDGKYWVEDQTKNAMCD